MSAPLTFSALKRPLLCLVFAALASCASESSSIDVMHEKSVEDLYAKGTQALEQGQFKEAAKNFAEVDRQHPYSQWAPRAQLMEAYAYHANMDYDNAIATLDQFIQLHPGNKSVAYAYYLRALCNYERISDVKHDQTAARNALKGLQEVTDRFPDTEYARDAALKITLINDHLAGAEMQVGRYYLRQRLYIAGINRFKTVVDRYQTTSHVPEALHRLVESYVALGLLEEAKKNAAVLGYNFPGSTWYQEAYTLLQSKGLSLPASDTPPRDR